MKARGGTLKRFSAALLALLLAMAMAPTTAFAASDTIDTSATGSLKLVKYDDPDGALTGTFDDTYMSQAERDAAIASLVTTNNLEPVEGATFRIFNVGTVAQYEKSIVAGSSTTLVTKIGYTVDSAVATWLGLVASDVDATVGGTDYYTPSTLQTKLASKTQAQVEAFMAANTTTADAATTNASGEATFSGLAVGLYLVAEYDYASTTTKTTVPFFVSVPTADPTAKDADGNVTDTEWIYDVTAYPKNQIEDVVTEKDIINEDGNASDEEDYQIGDYITYSARSTVPGAIGKLQTYRVTDTLSKGLTWDSAAYGASGTTSSYTVYGVAEDGTRTALSSPTNFSFTATPNADETTSLVWTFVPASLADANEVRLYAGIEIEYKVRLNSKAVVGSAGNLNDVKLEYSKTTNPESGDPLETKRPTTLPTVHTYAVDLLKYGDSDTSNPLAGVQFKLSSDAAGTNVIKVSEATAGTDGAYYLDPDGTGAMEIMTTDANGKLYVAGLEGSKAGTTYYLTEVATNQGYNLLASPIVIKITSNEGTYVADTATPVTGMFVQIASGTTYYADAACTEEFVLPNGVAADGYVDFGTSTVYTKDAAGTVTQVSPMYKAEEYQASVDTYNMEDGKVKLQVNNTKGFQLPTTGGEGTIMFLIVGGLIVAVAITALLVTRRRKNDSTQG